jgi:succinate-acetate transporter protein
MVKQVRRKQKMIKSPNPNPIGYKKAAFAAFFMSLHRFEITNIHFKFAGYWFSIPLLY